ncbi:MAG: gliding motility-associated C-terminal domain-containing protein [Chitinophagaceae bacterium]
MIRFLFFSLFIILTSFITHAQRWDWAQSLGNTKSDKIISVKTDSAGFIYISGYFSNSINIGTNALLLNNTANATSKELFLAKLDSTGYCYWARSGGEYFDDRVLGMDVDAAGNSLITGTFWQTSGGLNIGSVNITGAGFGGSDQCFIAKHDPNGNILWGTFVASNTGDDQGLDVAIDNKGNGYIVGFMTGNTLYCGGNTVTATNSNTGYQKHSYWLAKINSAGVFQWAKCFGNLPYDTAAFKYIERDIAVAVDEEGGVYVTGGYDHTWPFGNTSLTSSGGYDIFLMKYDTSGNFQWVTSGGSRKDDWSNGVCSDHNGHVYITGEHRDSLIVDTVLVKNYDKRDIFVLKFDATTGKPIWGKRAGSNQGGERGNDIWADSLCNVYVTGDVGEGAKFSDNIITPSGKSDEMFVAKISPDGKWLWAITGGGNDENDRGNGIAKGKGSQLYVGGFFRSSASYGSSNLASIGSSDGFLARVHDSSLHSFALERPMDSLICQFDTVSISIPEHAYFTYWPTIGTLYDTQNQLLRFFHTGNDITYILSGFSNGICPEYDTVRFTIYSIPNPVASFTINPKDAPITAPNFIFTNSSSGATHYEWYYDNTLLSTNTHESKTFDSAGTYCFSLVAFNDAGCSDTATQCGTIYDLEDVFFPNAFSPNQDGVNDFFGPVLTNISFNEISDFYFVIYNRYGERVFETDNPTTKWDGSTKNNNQADVGVYYYFCQFTSPRGLKVDKRGDVTLLK